MSDTTSAPFVSDTAGSFADHEGETSFTSSVSDTMDWFGTARALGRQFFRSVAQGGMQDPLTGAGQDIIPPEERTPPDVLQQKYGIPGKLKFEAPLPESVAAQMHETKREEMQRLDAIERRPDGLLSGAARYGAQFIADLLDPVNLAATMIPIAPALDLGVTAAAPLLSRLGARAAEGAVQGAAGMVPLAGLKYAMGQQEQSDYGAYNAMADIATGAGIGAVLHVGGGLLGDWLTGRVKGSSYGTAIQESPEARLAALNTAVAQMAEDRPVEVRPVFDAGPVPEHVTEPPTPGVGTPGASPFEAEIEPERLASFLVRQGGIKDTGGDVRSMLGGARFRPGLINFGGLGHDDAALMAWEHGFFPEHAEQRPDVNQFLEVLNADLRGHSPRYSQANEAAVEAYQNALGANHDILRMSDELGIPTTDITRAQFFDRVYDRLTPEDFDRRVGVAMDAHESAYEAAETMARDHTEANDEVWHPDEFYGGARTRTLEDLENEYRQEADAAPAGERSRGDEPAGPATEDQGSLQDGGGPGGPGAGASGRAGPQVLDDALRAASGERPPTPADLAADAAAKQRPSDLTKLAEQQVADHEEFFRRAQDAGALTEEVRAELEAINQLDAEGNNVANAALQAAACVARGML